MAIEFKGEQFMINSVRIMLIFLICFPSLSYSESEFLSSKTDFVFCSAGDFHLSPQLTKPEDNPGHFSPEENKTKFIQTLEKIRPNFVMLLGDLTMFGEFEYFRKWTDRFPSKRYWVIGNHDIKKGWPENWEKYVEIPEHAEKIKFNKTCYFFIEKIGKLEWAFIVMDNNRFMGKDFKGQLTWLKKTLDTLDERKIPSERRFFFAHNPFLLHPIVKIGGQEPLKKIAKILYGRVRECHFGHQHINYYMNHYAGIPPYYVVGLTTIYKSGYVNQMGYEFLEKRALLTTVIKEDGNVTHEWHSLE